MTFKKGLALSANRDLVNYLATSYENKGNSMCLYLKSLSGGITQNKNKNEEEKCEDHTLKISFQNSAVQIHDFHVSTSHTLMMYYS